MDQKLLAPLNALEASLNSLVQSLTTTNTFTAAPKAARDIVVADDDLTEALVELKKHQDNYNEILRLRAEKDALQQKLKDTVFEAWKLRTALGDIHPSILDDSEEEEEEAKKYNSVDYETLLSFASRIGKHNAIASQEAEKEAERRYIEARRKRDEEKDKSQPATNGSHAEDASAEARPTTSQSMHTQEVQARMQVIREARDLQRSFKTAPFPSGEDLRKGELGRLQLLREQHGEPTVDAAVEKMVRESEMKRPEDKQEPKPRPVPEPAPEGSRPETTGQPSQPRPPPPPPKPRKKIDLDFPEADDDDDE
ncbi:hypothetical protein PMZ80_010592 [Knufia obscura]|uniref:Mediator of RNA polymerase II transcription subunit 4 n=2 Tax=Knufia TaxID=430999 RepID=A0AAN8F2M0_9EURO|nr:hypothetical protein PMZ80_010592 [Knufia obscura]KAK5955288.1 hypothetical protein OHC33_003970 [Knufia fluminis]